MPPETTRDAIVIILDVGKSVSTLNYWESKTFFDQSRDCISWIVQRKLISQSRDQVCILMIGSDMADEEEFRGDDEVMEEKPSEYKNISCPFEFQPASWLMLKFINDEVRSTKLDSDWIGGLIVAMEMLNAYEKLDVIKAKRIVFFSDFTHPASDDLDVLADKIRSSKIEITIIGPTYIPHAVPDAEFHKPAKKKSRVDNEARDDRSKGEKLVSELWSKLPEQIVICSFETALKQLCAFIRKPVRKTPWNCIMDIGDVKINVSMFKKTDPKPPKKFNTKCLKESGENAPGPSTQTSTQRSICFTLDDITSTVRDKVMSYKHEMGMDSEMIDVQVQPEDTVEGFRYGTTIIPFGEEDKKVMQYKPGPKSFSVIGFTNISNVPYYLLSGERSYFVIPRDKDECAEIAFSGVVQAMKRMEVLAFVRRVYSTNSGLSLGILYPVIEEISTEDSDEILHKEYLLFVEVAFQEEIKSINFASLEPISKNLTEEQFNAIDSLIEGMDLMKADKGLRDEPCEAFETSKLHDYKEQFFNFCEIQRGLYPEKPLPTSLPPYIEEFIKTPISEAKIKLLAKELKEVFNIEVNEKKSVEEGGAKENDGNEELVMSYSSSFLSELEHREEMTNKNVENRHFCEADILEEQNPLRRGFMDLFSMNFPSGEEIDEFMNRLLDTREEEYFRNNLIDAFTDVVTRIRGMYLKKNPELYNWWLTKFREYAVNKSPMKMQMWSNLVYDELGLITEKENEHSRITKSEADKFFWQDMTVPVLTPTPKRARMPPPLPAPEIAKSILGERSGMSSMI